MTVRPWLAVAVLAAAAAGCGVRTAPGPDLAAPRTTAPSAPTPSAPTAGEGSPTTSDSPAPTPTGASAEASRYVRPAWLGERPLPTRPDGFGEVLPTPPELEDRRLAPPPSALPDPPAGAGFQTDIGPVPADVLARSTWHDGCPVAAADLAHVVLTFWGFDGRPHTGELLVHADAAGPLTTVFEALYEARFPIEEMRIVEDHELEAPPTGDGNNTTAFVCRPVAGGASWSQHARGLAVDVNPFHNPYVRGDLVLPELASAYVDRADPRPGMVHPDGPVVAAFDAIGWGWGGRWERPVDPMHFSATGR